jgi:hypothetical protein
MRKALEDLLVSFTTPLSLYSSLLPPLGGAGSDDDEDDVPIASTLPVKDQVITNPPPKKRKVASVKNRWVYEPAISNASAYWDASLKPARVLEKPDYCEARVEEESTANEGRKADEASIADEAFVIADHEDRRSVDEASKRKPKRNKTKVSHECLPFLSSNLLTVVVLQLLLP